jgi:PAS domain S-box-containing protein
VVCYFRDITRQVLARETIAQSEQRLRLASEAAELGIWLWNLDEDRAIWENERPYEIFGRTHEEGPISGAEFRAVCHPEDLAAFDRAMDQTVKTGARLFAQLRIYRKDGSMRWIELNGSLLQRTANTPLSILGTVLDITERKKVDAELRNYQRELEEKVADRTQELTLSLAAVGSEIRVRKETEQQLRELSGRLLRLQDEEHRRIARELHDSTGQTLSALKMSLSMLQPDVAHLPRARAIIDDLNMLADSAIQEIRTTSHLLHPPMLDDVGFMSAARWYLEGFSKRSGIVTTIDFKDLPQLTKDEELALFRVLQESLTNVHRHSTSTRAEIRIYSEGETVVLSIRDFGKGIAPENLDKFNATGAGVGVGLGGMKQRLHELGGNLEVKSQNKGITILAKLRLARAAEGLPLARNASGPAAGPS